MLRFETAGESHGECLVATLAGLPVGVPVSIEYLDRQLWRRQQGYGRGGRMKIEDGPRTHRLWCEALANDWFSDRHLD